MTRKLCALLLMLVTGQDLLAWDGSGSETDPWLIQTVGDWAQLVTDVNGGNSYAGRVFRMTMDITVTTEVGSDAAHAFCGTFDGDGHTLTYTKRGDGDNYRVSERCAPFRYVSGATIRHLKTSGYVDTSEQYAGGIISMVEGPGVTTLSDCQSDIELHGYPLENAAHGGLVGAVNTGGLVIDRCLFTGSIDANSSAGMVGWSNVDITITNSMVSPERRIGINYGRTFARMAGDATLTLTDCYYTNAIETEGTTPQGEGVFNVIYMPEGCTYKMQSEPSLFFDGKPYWKTGALVDLTAPEGVAFDHWSTGLTGCFLSDPWTRNGQHVLRDIKGNIAISIATTMPEAKLEREMDGTLYRYLTRNDYHLYMSDEERRARNILFEDGSGYLYTRAGTNNSAKCYITMVTGWKPGAIPSDGAQIHNDLSGVFHDYTLLAGIAPHAFDGCTELKTLYFKDTDANNFNAQDSLRFSIGNYAFANCPNLTEVKMMQYTTKKDNHWEMIIPKQISSVGNNVFTGSPQARVSCHRDVFQDFLNSRTWQPLWTRMMIYDATVADFSVNGAVYHYYRDSNEKEAVKNNDVGHELMRSMLNFWVADFYNFLPASVLAATDGKDIYYTQVVGADESYLRSNNGVMRIYNDPGSYYNYKTIAIGRDAFRDCKEVKAIEFWQTNGRSENSYSDLKIVIQNGAFKGCDNLKELRLFYFAQDGDDRWEILGPEDVIPGSNIFGLPSPADIDKMSAEEFKKQNIHIPKDFRILVSPLRYMDFMRDPNWAPYVAFIEPVEFDPNHRNKAFTEEGITYDYMTSPGGLLKTSQIVSQDFSWWSLAKWALMARSIITVYNGFYDAITTRRAASHIADRLAEVNRQMQESNLSMAGISACFQAEGEIQQTMLTNLFSAWAQAGESFTSIGLSRELCGEVFEDLLEKGLIDESGHFVVALVEHQAFTAAAAQIMNGLGTCIQSFAIRIMDLNTQLMQISIRAAIGAGLKQTGLWELFDVLIYGGIGWWQEANEEWYGRTHEEQMQKSMHANIMSNIHQWGTAGYGQVIQTPHKNLEFHTYIKSIDDNATVAKIYTDRSKGEGTYGTSRVVTASRAAFHNKKKLTKIFFHDNDAISSNIGMPLCFAFPDSAFVGCDNLTELNLLLHTKENGERPLGPENFILKGDSVFAGLDPAKFHIVIDPSRKDDFLANEMWKPLEKYFVYSTSRPETRFEEYGVGYAYVFENNSIKKENKVGGRLIEHMLVNSVRDEEIVKQGGTATVINDPGTWNNYQLDYIAPWAFRGSQALRHVQFVDLLGVGPFGQSYTGFKAALQDSCFANCPNLESVDLLYGITDQPDFFTQATTMSFESNHIQPMTPQMISIGNNVFAKSPKARLKMTEEQVAWFEADTAWAKYKERFLPCVFTTDDPGVRNALEDLRYHNPSKFSPSTWDDYYDVTRVLSQEGGLEWLAGRFSSKGGLDIRSFAAFKTFETVGLDKLSYQYFYHCRNLQTIRLPKTIRTIGRLSFGGCTALTEIELPEAVSLIEKQAFEGCTALRAIYVRRKIPCRLTGDNHFPKNDGMKIYVPDESVAAYLADPSWSQYKDYIVGASNHQVIKEVWLTKVGQLAEKLGLTLMMTHSDVGDVDIMEDVNGDYVQFDSLTVHGPLNATDIRVLAYLAGGNTWNFNGSHTEGRLRYLNLADANIKKDKNLVVSNYALSIYYIEKDDMLPAYAFNKCHALETVILPRSLKSICTNAFYQCINLKRLAFLSTDELVLGEIDHMIANLFGMGNILSNDLQETVFYTGEMAKGYTNDPFGANLGVVFTTPTMLPQYLGNTPIVSRTHNLFTPFADEAVIKTLASKQEYFPGVYLERESVEELFNDNYTITHFDDFNRFTKVKTLDRTFQHCTNLRSITLPDSLRAIGPSAFDGCLGLTTVRIATDSVPALAADVFESSIQVHGNSFQILVPRNLCNLYRERWSQYKDYINPDPQDYSQDTIIVVNTNDHHRSIAQALGLQLSYSYGQMLPDFSALDLTCRWVSGVQGDYSHIRKLKVIGPIGADDFSLLRFLSGWVPWTGARNYMGRLEYLDLYDAQIQAEDYNVIIRTFAPDAHLSIGGGQTYCREADVVPCKAFLKCYSLKTLILPKTVKQVNLRAMQECEFLETLVVGDSCTNFRWDALDDCASLSRVYLLGTQKLSLQEGYWFTEALCNNYKPTFEGLFVRPSLLMDYLRDPVYTSYKQQRTNGIDSGNFKDDESFSAFGAHAAIKREELMNIRSVEGWFDSHPDAKDLSMLRYTTVDTLSRATLAPLTKLERISMPVTLRGMQDSIFAGAARLHYVDLLMCDSTMVVGKVKEKGLKYYGIDTQRTLAFMPGVYGSTDETNVVVESGGMLQTKTYRLVDSLEYIIPYNFDAEKIENSRSLPKHDIPYTVCVPYQLDVPQYARAFRLSEREANVLRFVELEEGAKMEPFQPYLLKVVGHKRLRKSSATLNSSIAQTIHANGGTTVGKQVDVPGYSMRGTMDTVDNQTAADMGAYVLQGDGNWHPVSTATADGQKACVLPFRAFVIPSARYAGAPSIDMELVDLTDIDTIETVDHDGTLRYYDLQGREVDASHKGVVIVGGKKYFNK